MSHYTYPSFDLCSLVYASLVARAGWDEATTVSNDLLLDDVKRYRAGVCVEDIQCALEAMRRAREIGLIHENGERRITVWGQDWWTEADVPEATEPGDEPASCVGSLELCSFDSFEQMLTALGCTLSSGERGRLRDDVVAYGASMAAFAIGLLASQSHPSFTALESMLLEWDVQRIDTVADSLVARIERLKAGGL